MKVWKHSYSDPDLGTVLAWSTTRREAMEDMRAARKAQPRGASHRLEMVELPETPQGMCQWLNFHFNRDNG